VIAIGLLGLLPLVKGRDWVGQSRQPLLMRLLQRLPDPYWRLAIAIMTVWILGIGIAVLVR
jgi:hypothetical protein